MKIYIVFVTVLLILALYSCIPDQVVLSGDINGYVTDSETSLPIQDASVKLNESGGVLAVTNTESEGKYKLETLAPGNYELEVSKKKYKKVIEDVEVEEAKTIDKNFALIPVPDPEFSDTYLDYGFDTTFRSFTISNAGAGKLIYNLTSLQDWITVSPRNGEATTETDTVYVTIDRNLISEEIQEGIISIVSYIGDDLLFDTVRVLVNGVIDHDGIYYPIVTIGSQTWMAKNLNTGTMISYGYGLEPEDNGKAEKYCYNNAESNCAVYGGLYPWGEVMDYFSDSVYTGAIQGICPDGWHIPTGDEWGMLYDFLGGVKVAGGKLKDTTSLWEQPNIATNESGFSALPGGNLYALYFNTPAEFGEKGNAACFWTAYSGSGIITQQVLVGGDEMIWSDDTGVLENSFSVRCIKDP